jgi:ribosomal protein S18 acetylase RimI-like enzyme
MLSPIFDSARLDPITEADYEIVTRLAETIWRTHYISMISMEQIEYMLSERYTPDKLRQYISAGDRGLDVLRLAGGPIGYCSYARTFLPGEMKLEQLYVLQGYRGNGIGGLMLRHVEAQARKRGCSSLVLQVNKRNADSIAFYRKAGFSVREESVFDIGNGFVMDDYVMVKML